MWRPADRVLVGDFGAGQALSDDQYRLIEPMIPRPKPGGRPRTTDMRRLLDGLFYVVRTGCQWRHLPPPPAFPPWPTVYGYFRTFLVAGTWESMRHHLVMMLREQASREASPTAAIIDTQSVKTTEKGGRAATMPRRKSKAGSATSRSTAQVCCSASGVHAADIQDADGAGDLLWRLKRLYPWLKAVFADSVYDRIAVLLACFLLGLTLIVVRRIAGTTGFVLLPRRWVVERTFGWLGRWRRLARDYEELPEVSEAMVKLATIRLMLQRFAYPNRKLLAPT